MSRCNLDLDQAEPWSSQSCHRKGFYCCQGLVNLNYCGPEDGGLMILEGSNQLVERFFDENGRDSYTSWGPFDWHGFSEEDQQWFYNRGCKWTKVCGEPGDLFLWDSRTMHFNVRPTGEKDRVCTCELPQRAAPDLRCLHGTSSFIIG